MFALIACTPDGSSTGSEAGQSVSALVADSTPPKPLAQLQKEYVDLRFGMFLHFGILTYTGSWAQPNLPINQFNPTNLNPGQWADAAVAAKMKFGVLTARHHDGFALWPSKASSFNVGNIPWRNGQGDVVREYVDAFRARGLGAGLYYSIWDATQGIGNSNTITAAQMQYVKTQLTELMTNYGPIPVLVLDGWAWKMGHQRVAYEQIRELVKSLQPNCLISDQSGVLDQWDADLTVFEEPKGVWAPSGNKLAAHQQQKINWSGGNDWFWSPTIGNYMTVTQIVNEHLKVLESRYTTFVLNTPPNRLGLLDAAIVTRLAEVGAAWTPNAARAPLPTQPRLIEHPYTPVSAYATSGTAYNAIDGVNDIGKRTLWKTSGSFPQSVTADLGVAHNDVGMLTVLPPYGSASPTTTGNITRWTILVSTNGSYFWQVATGTWPADGKSHTAVFGPTWARWVRFQVNAANTSYGQLTDITIGANR
ncbi:MAG: alpha-L-fucosidase [Fibrobacteria bacterium]